MNTLPDQLEINSVILTNLVPGKTVLGRVPLFNDAIEISTPENRPRICLDMIIEPDLIEISRSDQKEFNICDYRSEGTGSLVPHLAFERPIGSLLLRGTTSGDWVVDGLAIEIIDPVGVDSFVRKVASAALVEERGDRGSSYTC